MNRLVYMFSVFVLLQFYAYAQAFDWAKSMSGSVYGQAISTDANGNSYVTGYFEETATFGSTQITSSGSSGYADIFIAKYDANGNFLWVQKAGGTYIDNGYGISTDANGNCYITGSFTNTATFGSTQIISSGPGYADIFIAKYDANGNFQWVQKAGGTFIDIGYGISTDANGNCYITGSFTNTATFGSTQITSSGNDDIFIAKYDANGNFLWVQKAGGPNGSDDGYSISTDANGNCYITGSFWHYVYFGSTQITSNGGYDIYIAKYDANGNFKWVQKAGGTNYDYGYGISADDAGNSYVTGNFKGTATFGSTQITSSEQDDIFITKYDANGNFLWVQKAGGASTDRGFGISTDENGNCYVTGYFNGTATFGTTQITSSGQDDIFIAKNNPSGNFLWVRKAGGTSNDRGFGISTDNSGNCYVTGSNSSNSNFGNISLTSWGGFITKLSTPTLNITSPIGGEVWQTNTAKNITWNSVDDGNVKIEITTNNGTNWIVLQNSVEARLGNFTLNVPPFSNSDQSRIRLASVSYGTVSTGGLFTITSANVPNLTITSPNTGVKWNAGSSQNITWTQTGSIDNIKLEYTTDNGNNWITIAASTPASIGTYNWTIPSIPSTSCRVRISDVSNFLVNDVSNELFTIANISILAPTAGEKWKAQSNKDIKWNSTNVTNINFYYSTDDGTSWTTISNSVTAGNGTFNWNVPNVESTNSRIKIEDATDNTIFIISELFEIWKPQVSTQTPASGQVTQNFGISNITFSAFVMVSAPATITYFPYETPQQGTLPSGVEGVSNYYWTFSSSSLTFINGQISVPLSTLAGVEDSSKIVWLIRTSTGGNWINVGGSVSGSNLISTVPFESFTEFAIGFTELPVPPSVVLISPNGGEEWQVNSQQNILWNFTGNVDNVKLEYTTNNGTQWKSIVNSTSAGVKSYQWTVPNEVSVNCRVKISSVQEPTVNDISDSVFSIIDNKVLIVKNNAQESKQLEYGFHPLATNGIDPALGEILLPPVPPSNVFDVRFELPVIPAEFSMKDFRSDTTKNTDWLIKIQAGDGGYPVTLSWDSSGLSAGSFRLKDVINGSIVNVNMKGQSSLVISNTGITALTLEFRTEVCKDLPLFTGWNMVSVPLMAADMRRLSIFPNATSPMYGYMNGYQTKDTAALGKGYWIRYATSSVVEVCGTPVDVTTIPVNAGWNIIGIYDNPVSVNGITTTPANIITSNFFGYNSGYVIPTTLGIGKGYWIRANQNGVINLNSALLAKGTETPSINEKWSSLTLTDRTGKTSRLYLSVGKENLSSYDLPPVPPEGIFDVRFASDRMVENVSTRQEIIVNSAEYPVEVGLRGIEGLGSLEGLEGLGGLVVRVERGNERTEKILKDGETILVGEGSRIFVETVEIPREFGLSQNYPNPFNPSTVISYQLPVDSKVTLKLYDVLGREVATLIDEQKEAGSYNYDLHMTSYGLSSGVYLYEMRAGDFRNVKKMVLIK